MSVHLRSVNADLQAARTFEFRPEKDFDSRYAVLNYWGGAGFAMRTCGEGRFEGRRGSLWGNLTSFDARKLIAQLSVQVNAESVKVDMQVKGTGQIITDYNRAYLALELAEFESVMRGTGPLPETWSNLLRRARKSFWTWSLSVGQQGHVLDEESDIELRKVGVNLEEVRLLGVR